MDVTVTLSVTILAKAKDGNVDIGPLRDAVYSGLDRAKQEGYLTPLDNEDVTIESYSVAHVSTAAGT